MKDFPVLWGTTGKLSMREVAELARSKDSKEKTDGSQRERDR